MGGELEISRRAGELRKQQLRSLAVRRAVSSPARLASGMKRGLTRMLFAPRSYRLWWSPGQSGRKYAREVGDGTGNSAVAATLDWIGRTFPEAPALLWSVDAQGEETPLPLHDLVQLLHRPNDFYSGETLWKATLWDYHSTGDAYWMKIRKTVTGGVGELWYVPSFQLEPKGTETEFLTHYELRNGGTADPVRIETTEIVHFRNGLDPNDVRKGRSPLRAALAEIFTDEEAAAYTATILKNMGVPGVVVSPDTDAVISDEDVQATKQALRANFTGENRGEPMVSPVKVRVDQFGFSPEQLNLRALRRVPEERVTALLGVPAIVVGLGAGLDRSTFANMAEAREAAMESRIVPDQRSLAAEVRFQLLPEFEQRPELFRFGFDLSKVRVLQEDENRQHERARENYKAGVWTRAQALRAVGMDASDDDEVYLVPINVVLTPKDAAGAAALEDELAGEAQRAADATANLPPPGTVPPPTNGNGNSDGTDAAAAVAALVGAGA